MAHDLINGCMVDHLVGGDRAAVYCSWSFSMVIPARMYPQAPLIWFSGCVLLGST